MEDEWRDMHELLLFFSSRRRHTTSLCDWSSDVCSSDLSLMLRKPPKATPSSTSPMIARLAGGDHRARAAGGGLRGLPQHQGAGGERACRRAAERSEERRVGEECSDRWARTQIK